MTKAGAHFYRFSIGGGDTSAQLHARMYHIAGWQARLLKSAPLGHHTAMRMSAVTAMKLGALVGYVGA